MPRFTDPAPCAQGEDLYECGDCLARFCSGERLAACPECGATVENLTKPSAE